MVQPEDGRGVLGRPDAAAFVGDAGAVVLRLDDVYLRIVAVLGLGAETRSWLPDWPSRITVL